MNNYDYEQPLCPPEPIVAAECEICCCEIYADEEYYRMDDGRIVCQDCLAEWAADFAAAMCNGVEQ